MAEWNLLDVVNSVILKFPAVLKFPLMIFNFPLLFSHSKNIRMSTLITIIITYYLLIIIIIIITKSHNNYCSAEVKYGVMFIKFVDIDFVCNSYPLYSLRACHMWLTRNHMFKKPRSVFEIKKFQKSELGKFIQISLLKMW